MTSLTRTRWAAALLFAAITFAGAGCTAPSGNFSIWGYTTEPNYDQSIRTVYVPIAQNVTYRRGIEFDLTRAVIREIGAKTTMQIVSCRERADTVLEMKIVNWRKNMIIPNLLNLPRDVEVGLGVEVIWRDLRPGCEGEILSNPKKARAIAQPLPGQIVPDPDKAVPILLLPMALYQPELGGSTASAEKQAIDRFAVQVTSMMEKGW